MKDQGITRFPEPHAALGMTIAMLLWSLSNVTAKILSSINVIDLIFFRSVVSAILFAAIGIRYQLRIKNASKLLLRGSFSGLALGLSYMAIPHVPISNIGIISQLAPLITAIIATILLREKVKKRQWLLGVICLCGVFISYEFQAIESVAPSVLMVLGVISSAIGYVLVRRGNSDESALAYACSSSLICIVVCGPFVQFEKVQQWTSLEFILIIGLGLLTSIAQLLANSAYQRLDASKVAFFHYLNVPFALALGYIFFQEPFTTSKVIGGMVILIGLAINYQSEKKFERND